MATKGLTEEEVDRQGSPRRRARDAVRMNGFWPELSDAHESGRVSEDLRTFSKFFDEVKVADLDPLAKEYLKRERASVAIVAPKKKAAETGTTEAAAPPKKD
jgi:hypothetical protein